MFGIAKWTTLVQNVRRRTILHIGATRFTRETMIEEVISKKELWAEFDKVFNPHDKND